MKWYVCFLGTVTIPIQAETRKAERAAIIASYADRGISLASREVFVRLARRDDAAWIREMGASAQVVAALEGLTR